MADLTTLRARLLEAEAAAHDLAMGKSVVEVRRDGRSMRWNSGTASSLTAYIAQLRGEIADLEAAEAGVVAPSLRRPIGARWG